MIRLRPHHLLCTQGYSGNGYNRAFVENMDKIMEALKNKDTNILMTFSTDHICSKCPNMLGENHCVTNDKVLEIDRKVREYFALEERVYNYFERVKFIRDNITVEMMDDICGKCEWYAVSSCKKNICG